MKIALVGVGGYGGAYINFFRHGCLPPDLQLTAAVEPFPDRVADIAWLRDNQIPVYPTLEALYAAVCPELVILSTPIPLHKPQAIFCMEHGSHVLCEKPLTPSFADAMEMKAVSLRTGRLLGVGFQWSFTDTMLRLKKDLHDGILGKPLFFRTHISWTRPESYYTSSSWKGRIRTENGDLVRDNILTNATAHYLHNIFFINGAAEDEAAMPVSLRGFLARTYPIETFDTCFVEGTLPNGCRFLHIATHSGSVNSEPKLVYEFENATVYFDSNTDPVLYALFKDGTRKEYGQPLSEQEVSQKVSRMAAAIRSGSRPCCGVDTILPHLRCCNALLEQVPIRSYPEEQQARTVRGGETFRYTEGLYEQTVRCYEQGLLPDEAQEVHV